jgi:hypothetical protein
MTAEKLMREVKSGTLLPGQLYEQAQALSNDELAKLLDLIFEYTFQRSNFTGEENENGRKTNKKMRTSRLQLPSSGRQ